MAPSDLLYEFCLSLVDLVTSINSVASFDSVDWGDSNSTDSSVDLVDDVKDYDVSDDYIWDDYVSGSVSNFTLLFTELYFRLLWWFSFRLSFYSVLNSLEYFVQDSVLIYLITNLYNPSD